MQWLHTKCEVKTKYNPKLVICYFFFYYKKDEAFQIIWIKRVGNETRQILSELDGDEALMSQAKQYSEM